MVALSYPCCDRDCPYCGLAVCKCTCQAARDESAAIEARHRFVAAYRELDRSLLDLATKHPNKSITLKINPRGYGLIGFGFRNDEAYSTPEELWKILTRLSSQKPAPDPVTKT